MREILFRGKRIDNGEWVYGDLVQKAEYGFCWRGIMSQNIGETQTVIPETVGQYTGLTANGTKIFEGDIVKSPFSGKKLYTFSIQFFEGGFYAFPEENPDTQRLWKYRISGENKKMRIIGNIHDNPELLRGVNNE